MSLPSLRKYRIALAALLAAVALPAMAADLQMWERSGGNAKMVDTLVAMWNEKNPDRKINLTYIEHSEMVAKLAQAVASGEVPDLMGMDLIYAPQFEKAGQLVDITDKIKDWPELKTASPGHMTVATYENRLYGVPLYADVSALFYNKDLFEKAGLDPNKPPTSLGEIREYADKITALGGDIKGYYLAGLLRRLQHLYRRPADVGLGRQDRDGRAGRRASGWRWRQAGAAVRPRHHQGRRRPRERPRRDRQHLPPAIRVGQGRHDGHWQLQHPAGA